MAWSGADTKLGHLSPLETCKAFAFHVSLETISSKLKKPTYELLGQRTNAWIAEQLTLKGGGCPSERAVQAAVAKCKADGWQPGQTEKKAGGRPPTYTIKQKKAIANAAMSLKRKIVRPTVPSGKRRVPSGPRLRSRDFTPVASAHFLEPGLWGMTLPQIAAHPFGGAGVVTHPTALCSSTLGMVPKVE